jgi:predicted component of type VI protein secretion system
VNLLSERAVAKRELRIELTETRQRENNPLKSSPTIDDALRRLLGPQKRLHDSAARDALRVP